MFFVFKVCSENSEETETRAFYVMAFPFQGTRLCLNPDNLGESWPRIAEHESMSMTRTQEGKSSKPQSPAA